MSLYVSWPQHVRYLCMRACTHEDMCGSTISFTILVFATAIQRPYLDLLSPNYSFGKCRIFLHYLQICLFVWQRHMSAVICFCCQFSMWIILLFGQYFFIKEKVLWSYPVLLCYLLSFKPAGDGLNYMN